MRTHVSISVGGIKKPVFKCDGDGCGKKFHSRAPLRSCALPGRDFCSKSCFDPAVAMRAAEIERLEKELVRKGVKGRKNRLPRLVVSNTTSVK